MNGMKEALCLRSLPKTGLHVWYLPVLATQMALVMDELSQI